MGLLLFLMAGISASVLPAPRCRTSCPRGTSASVLPAPQETLEHLASLQDEGKDDAALDGYIALSKSGDKRIAAHAHFFAGQILLKKNQVQSARPHLLAALALAQENALTQLALYARFQLGVAANMEGKYGEARAEFQLCYYEAGKTDDALLLEQTHLELLRLALLRDDAEAGEEIRKHWEPFLLFDGDTDKALSGGETNAQSEREERSAEQGHTDAERRREAELRHRLTQRLGLRLDAARALLNGETNQGRAALALRLAEICLEYDRENWLLIRARALRALSRNADALASLEKLSKKNAEAVLLEADIRIGMGDEERGLGLLKAASERDEGQEKRLLAGQYAHRLLEARRYAEAAPILQEIARQQELAQRDGDGFVRRQALLDLASLALASGDAPLAERHILASGVTNAPALRLLAAALIAQGKTGEAAQGVARARLGATQSENVREASGQSESAARARTMPPREAADLAILEAALAWRLQNTEQTHSAATRAREQARLANAPRIEAEALVLLSLTTNAEAARALLLEAREVAANNGLAQAEANIWHNLGVLALLDEEDQKRNAEAVLAFRRALELFDATRARFALRSEERLQYTATWSETQRFLALAHLAADRIEAAWEAYEHSLARETREALAESLLRSSANFAESVRAQERALDALQRARLAGAAREEIEEREHALRESTQKVERELLARERGQGRPQLTRKAFSEQLKKSGTLALQYLVWPDGKPGIAFIIDGSGISVTRLPPSRELLEKAARFRQIAASPLLARVWDAQTLGTKTIDHRMSFVTNGLALNAILLDPIAERWESSQASNLLVIADGELAAFPFAALPLPGEKWKRGQNWPACLGDEVPIMTAVSAAAWMESEWLESEWLEGEWMESGGSAHGAVVLAGDVGERRIRDGRIMPALPGSGREIEAIARIFGRRAVSLRGDDATPEGLASLIQERAPAILHLATHGFFLTNAVSGKLHGALLLAGETTAGGTVPAGSVLDEAAIAGLPLVGNLVTLSSCESARGRIVAGEGILSLMRAFIIAGAKSVSASLWIIGDDSTAEYMTKYYRRIAAGIRPAAAHRDTRRELSLLGFWPSQRSGFITSN